ncbi:MAG: hypothetical protein UT10_C0031G0007 [Candidatus Woesebacteria bacterium GW2011_GWB1_38_8b]|uniref:Uncharacterized protein n=1 Tax=Candidatus Woesebacteria bacterium GW2011_GWB1_38_8b TaxID=1618571 RepID=A0A0G0LDX9_9BACT|nr:MAG: hypothetical protein UT10_C0031G0007 [Candidatus Woesebacteria bacterium GW2011_GWB1_38_8b]
MIDPVLRERWDNKTGQWELDLYQYLNGDVSFVRTLTVNFDEDFRNPSFAKDDCIFAAQVKTGSGWEIRVYTLGMSRVDHGFDVEQEMYEPEVALVEGDPILARGANGWLYKLDYRTGEVEAVGLKGSYPHSVPVSDTEFRFAYTNQSGNLSIVYEDGKRFDYEMKCDRPEILPDGTGVFCREVEDGLGLFTPLSSATMQPNRLATSWVISYYRSGFASFALDPDGTLHGVLANEAGFYFSPDLWEDVPLNVSSLGFGTDWGSTNPVMANPLP